MKKLLLSILFSATDWPQSGQKLEEQAHPQFLHFIIVGESEVFPFCLKASISWFRNKITICRVTKPLHIQPQNYNFFYLHDALHPDDIYLRRDIASSPEESAAKYRAASSA